MYIRGKPSVFHKVVFELRYRHGFNYLDRCGKTINAIVKASPEWILRSAEVSPQNAPMVSTVNQCVFNFSFNKLDFSLEQASRQELNKDALERFLDQVDLLSKIVIDQLSLKEFSRIGLRTWYMFPCRDKVDADNWLINLGLYSFDARIGQKFNGVISRAEVAITVHADDRDYRIGFNGVERLAVFDLGSEFMGVRTSTLSREQNQYFLQHKGQKQNRLHGMPEFAALIDVDAFQDEPEWPDPMDFARTSVTESQTRIDALLAHSDKDSGR